MWNRRRIVTAVAVGALALGAPALSACGNVAEQAVEEAAEQAMGGEVDVEDGQVTVTESDGTEVTVGEDVALPDSWPDAVPAFEGTLVSVAVGPDAATADAMWTTDATAEEAMATYGAALEAAGYTAGEVTAMAGMSSGAYTGNGYTVTVTALGAEGSPTSLVVSAIQD